MDRLPGGALLVFFVLAAVSVCAADEQAPGRPEAGFRAVTAAAVSVDSEQKLHAAFDHLYNLEFTQALQDFEQVARAEPDSATVRAFWASGLLYEILARQGSLQSQLFVTTNEFLSFQRLPPDPALEKQFLAAADETERVAQRRLQANPQDTDALFALGLIYGNRANYLAGAKAEYIAGLRAGEKAFDYHTKLREVNPEIHDAEVILGVHDYVIGSLPRTQRFVLFFLGSRGNRERGIQYLRDAAEKGEFLRTYAQVLQVVAHLRQNEVSPALVVAEELLARYPRNPIFMLEVAKMYRQLERYPQALDACRTLVAELLAHPHNPRVLGPEDGLLEMGLIEAAENNFQRALETLGRVGEIPGANSRVQARALLERGKLLDRMGKRELAVAEYEKVARLAAEPGLTRQANAYRKRPYRPEADN